MYEPDIRMSSSFTHTTQLQTRYDTFVKYEVNTSSVMRAFVILESKTLSFISKKLFATKETSQGFISCRSKNFLR